MEKKIVNIDVRTVPDDEMEDYIKEVAAKFKKGVSLDDVDIKLTDYDVSVPDSHHWSDLDQIIRTIEYDLQWEELRKSEQKDDNAVYRDEFHEQITVEYLMIGLKNTLKHGYKLAVDMSKLKTVPSIRTSSDMLEYLSLYLDEDIRILENWTLRRFRDELIDLKNNGFYLKNERTMERKEVYERIDGERNYQDLRWTPRREANGITDEQKAVADWLLYIEHHLEEAKVALYYLRDEDTLAQVRKIAGLAVRCLELHGCPERVIPDELLNEN